MRALVLTLLGACAPDDKAEPDSGSPEDTGQEVEDADPDDPDGSLAVGDANNYAFTGTLDAPSFAMAEYSDAALSWAELETDIQCHALDPVVDIDNTSLLVFPRLTEEEVEAGLSDDSLEQVDLGVYLSYAPGDETSASLSQFTFFGTDAEIENEFAEGSGTWMVLLTTGTTVGVGARMMAFLEPRADSDNQAGEIEDGCPVLDYSVDLGSLEPIAALPAGPWAFDWSALERTGQGTDFDPLKVSEVMVAWYADLSPDDLEQDFLDLELLADGMWTAPHLSGTSADLSTLTHITDDSAFPGFTESGTWLLALRCKTCPNPAPLFLTQVIPGT